MCGVDDSNVRSTRTLLPRARLGVVDASASLVLHLLPGVLDLLAGRFRGIFRRIRGFVGSTLHFVSGVVYFRHHSLRFGRFTLASDVCNQYTVRRRLERVPIATSHLPGAELATAVAM
jgi:hypothetical protein